MQIGITKGFVLWLCSFVCTTFHLHFLIHASSDNLVLVQIIFRHGDRSPTRLYPTDPHPVTNWPRGLGQLTTKGIWRSFNLGKFFKKTYVEEKKFLPRMFNVKDVYIRSTGYDRTIMTAQAVMTAMYPPDEKEAKWNPNALDFPWQPIPIYSFPKKDDLILRYGNKCPRQQRLQKEELSKNEDLQRFLKDDSVRRALDSARNHSGFVGPDFMMYQLYDTLYVERENNMTLPSWADEEVLKVLEELQILDYHALSATDELKRLTGGNLLAEIFKNVKNEIEEKEEKEKKAFFYSAHDSTLMALLGVLDVYYDVKPEYNSFVAFELFEGLEGHSLKVFYRNDTSIEPEQTTPLTLKPCQAKTTCLFQEVLEYYENRHLVVKDYNAECKDGNDPLSENQLKRIVAGLATLAGFLFATLLLILIMAIRRYQKEHRLPTHEQ